MKGLLPSEAIMVFKRGLLSDLPRSLIATLMKLVSPPIAEPLGDLALGLTDGEGRTKSSSGEVNEAVGDGGVLSSCEAGGGALSFSSAFLLGDWENGRRHRAGVLQAGASSGKSPRGDWARRRRDAVLFMA